MSRFEAFDNQEQMYIAYGLTLMLADMVYGVIGDPAPPEVFAEFVNKGLPLMDEIGDTIDPGDEELHLDPELMMKLRWKLANEIEAREGGVEEETEA